MISLRQWLIHFKRFFGKNSLVRFSVRAIIFFWSRICRTPLREIQHIRKIPSDEPASKDPYTSPKTLDGCQEQDFETTSLRHPSDTGVATSNPSTVCCLEVPQDSGVIQDIEPMGYTVHAQTPSGDDIPRAFSPIEAHGDVLEPIGDVCSVKTSACLSHPRIRALFPEGIQRYDRNVAIPRRDTEYIIPPMTTNFTSQRLIPGWTPRSHPEGALYFHHEQKRIFTDANLYDDDIHSQIHSDIDTIESFMCSHNIRRSPHDDLVLEMIRQDDGSIKTFYYFANHSKRCIYFLDEFKASELEAWGEVQGATSPTHIKHEIEVQYWCYFIQQYHCLLFPQALELSHELIVELRDIVVYNLGDAMLSQTSTSPYNVDDLQKMIQLVNNMKHNVGTEFRGSTCMLSTLMHLFVQQRFYNFHGQPGARLGRDQSVYGPVDKKRSWLILSLSPLLFFAPEVHLRALENMWIDQILRGTVWKQFMDKLNTEWQEFTLYATVLLNANVAFLAIQSVDEGHYPSRSAAQISSYVSIVASVGSIILGLLLVRQNRTKSRDTATDIAGFLHRRTSFRLGLETLAIMFGLPYALLMWGMVSFLAAFLFMCFQDSNVVTRLLVGATWIAIAILIIWCIWMAWEPRLKHTPATIPEIKEPPEDNDRNSQITKRFWTWRIPQFRRSSYDSDQTAV